MFTNPKLGRAAGLLAIAALAHFFASPAQAAIVTSSGSGLWSDGSTWSTASTPTDTDEVIIAAGHTVTVDNFAEYIVSTVTVQGTLTFGVVDGSTLTLSGGDIIIEAGGALIMGEPGAPIGSSFEATLNLAMGSPGQFGLIVKEGGRFVTEGNPANRNVIIRSSGTTQANASYIQSLTTSATSFMVTNAQFLGIGAGSAGLYREGIAFTSTDARGIISSSTIRNGYYGVKIVDTSKVHVQHCDIFGNASDGILIASADQNRIEFNRIYNNGNNGIQLFNDSGMNTVYKNHIFNNTGAGIRAQNNIAGNVYVGNLISTNTAHGIRIDGGSGATFAANSIYSNGSNALFVSNATSLVFKRDLFGYNETGASFPNTGAEILFDGGTVSKVDLYNATINPATGVAPTGFAQPLSLLRSYRDGGVAGRLVMWGDHKIVSGNFILQYTAPLYPSGATSPRLIQGTGHSISSLVPGGTNVLTELITVKNTSGSNWAVVGSSSGVLGNITCATSATCTYPGSKVTFMLNTGAKVNTGDMLDFVTFEAAKDENTQKKLLFGPVAGGLNGGHSRIVLDSTSDLILTGTAANPVIVDMLETGSTYFTFVASGPVSATHASFANLDPAGLQLSGNAGILLTSATFDLAGGQSGTRS
jgi:parallel beta-helix repeat protein